MASGDSAGGGVTGTGHLLGCGVVAGPLYLAVGIAQGLLRDGFDFDRHPLSVLANGPGGWVQTANFVISGALVVAAAIGIGRLLRPKARGVTWCLAAYGLAMIAGAMFRADPVDGFPPGTPLGPPTTISPTGLAHFAAGGLAFLCLGLSGLLAARPLARRNEPALARLSLFSGIAVLLGFFGGMAPAVGVLGIWFAVVVGWAWLTAVSLRLQRLA